MSFAPPHVRIRALRHRTRRVHVRRTAAIVAAVAGGGLVVASGLIHLRLWAMGYRQVPTIGPLFLLQGGAGLALGVVTASWRRAVVLGAGAAFLAATIGGFALSATAGLFGFHDGLAAPWAGPALVVEAVGIVVLVAGVWLVRRPGATESPG